VAELSRSSATGLRLKPTPSHRVRPGVIAAPEQLTVIFMDEEAGT